MIQNCKIRKKTQTRTKRDKGKNKKLYQFLQENGVAALQTICYENKEIIQFQML